ncbi:MAG: hypothetical protein D6781_12760 [Verrucomicrobia bacterium]|nr:MAG: hypothetical protein D6781_12760 [Verrucomicrobiota bacterium]
MARISPDPLVGSIAPEVHKVYRALRAIPGDDVAAWVSMPLPGSSDRPEFLAVYRGGTAFVIAVATVGQSEAEEIVHGGLFSMGKHSPGDLALPQRTMTREFVTAILGEDGAGDPATRSIVPIVLFPNVANATLRDAFRINPLEGIYWIGREHTNAEGLLRCFQRLSHGHLTDGVLAELRARFTPESVIPERFVAARQRRDRGLRARLAPLLLDYDQEWWTKHRLALPDDCKLDVSDAPVSGPEATLVTGVAGSGKSLVLLYRACHQARLRPDSRSLVLTHNRALRRELEQRFGELGRPPNVEWATFFSWANRYLAEVTPVRKVVQYRVRDDMIGAAARPVFGTIEPRQIDFLEEEFDWMLDRDILTCDAYLRADRTGRGVRLTEADRRKVFRVFENYRHALCAAGCEDWAGRALRFWHLVRDGKIRLRPYDFIYVDEAQFFAPVWFLALRRVLKPGTGRLFLAADPTQGFLKRRQSWLSCGLELRGRSTRLRRSYRNTRPILEFAATFYQLRLGTDDDEINLPGDDELASAPEGVPPLLLRLTSRQDELTRVANEIRVCLAEGIPAADILLIVASGQRARNAVESLQRLLGPERVSDARQASPADRIRVCALDGATGIEAPIVFLVGIEELLAAEAALRLSPEQREELIRDNTRRLYMAFTRAACRLVVTWTSPSLPPWWTEAGGTTEGRPAPSLPAKRASA